MKISEMITDRYKLRIPPTVYYDLLADVQELEEEQDPTTKNDLGVDCISRQFIYELGATCIATRNENGKLIALGAIEELPSVTPQEPQTFRWCTDCREYNQEKHCCHRWSKVIRNTVEEMKQEYIEREVLDKIRAEIEQLPTNTRINWDGCLPDIDYPEIEYVDVSKAGLLEIINKYKAESEVDNG